MCPDPSSSTVSICLATYRRNDQLALLLGDLAQQTRRPDEVIVVDNDAAGTAQATVEQMRASAPPFSLVYEVQPRRSIPITRNRTVALADGDWLAFIDDDERAPPDWLATMLDTVTASQADGVLGHVHCVIPDDAPEWVRRGDFYGSPRNPHGEAFPLNRISKGNAVLRASRVKTAMEPWPEPEMEDIPLPPRRPAAIDPMPGPGLSRLIAGAQQALASGLKATTGLFSFQRLD